MKFCPYCGVSLVDGTVSFCSECGKSLKSSAEEDHGAIQTQPETGGNYPRPEQSVNEADQDQAAAENSPRHAKHQKIKKKKRPIRFKKGKKAEPVSEPDPPDPQDEGYDGYYDDVMPGDDGHISEGLDPELIKRIAIIAAGALVLVGFSILVMYVL